MARQKKVKIPAGLRGKRPGEQKPLLGGEIRKPKPRVKVTRVQGKRGVVKSKWVRPK